MFVQAKTEQRQPAAQPVSTLSWFRVRISPSSRERKQGRRRPAASRQGRDGGRGGRSHAGGRSGARGRACRSGRTSRRTERRRGKKPSSAAMYGVAHSNVTTPSRNPATSPPRLVRTGSGRRAVPPRRCKQDHERDRDDRPDVGPLRVQVARRLEAHACAEDEADRREEVGTGGPRAGRPRSAAPRQRRERVEGDELERAACAADEAGVVHLPELLRRDPRVRLEYRDRREPEEHGRTRFRQATALRPGADSR